MTRGGGRWLSLGSPAAIAFLAAALILSLGTWQIGSSRRDALHYAELSAKTLARTLAQHAQRTIETVDLALDTMAEQVRSGRDARDVARSFHSSELLRQALNVAITDRSGKWLANTALLDNSFDSGQRAYFRALKDGQPDQLVFDTPVRSLSTGRVGIPIARRISDANGAFAGVVVATLRPDYFSTFYASVRIGAQGTIALWSEDGRILVRDPETSAGLAPVVEAARSFAAGPSGFVRSRSPLDGIERLFAFEHVGRYPVVVSVGESKDDALAAWRRQSVMDATVTLTAATVLTALGIVLGRRQRATSRLEAASRDAERTRSEAERLLRHQLTEANRLLRLAEEIAQVGHWRLALPSQAVTWSSQVFRIHGLDPSLYRPTVETAILHYHEDDRAEIERCVADAIRHGTAFEANLRILRADGSVRRVISRGICETGPSGEVQAVFGTFMDVTDARQAEADLAASERRYRILAETSSDVVTQLDLDMLRTYVSPSCRSLLGFEPDEMLGARPSSSIHPDEAPAVRDLAARLAAGEVPGDRATVTYRTRHKNGDWVWVEAILNLLRDAQTGRPLSLICSLRDVTERQRAAHHLERAAALAEQAARAKAEFLANTSHELRTPLAGIIGMHDVLLASPGLAAEHRRQIRSASEAGRSLLTIVNDILDLSKIDAGQLDIESIAFDADALFADCRALACGSLGHKPIAIDLRFVPDVLGSFDGDPTRIKQITNNLLSNAIKFTPGGQVLLEVVHDEPAGRLRVTVTDTGIGLPSEGIDSLFDRFTQADASMSRRFGGTGLGLAICKRLVDLMGGQLGARSRPEGGALFWFELPLRRAMPLPSRGETARPIAIEPRTVLLAEDNPLSAEIVTLMLTARGHRVVRVDNGAEVVAARERDDIDVVLMDMQMPVMDGLEAARRIRQAERARSSRGVPIIGLTANATSDDAQRCVAAGMDAHVAKPIDWVLLLETIHRLTRRSPPDATPEQPTRDVARPVLDQTCLDELSRIIGSERVSALLTRFVAELAARVVAMSDMDFVALSAETHKLVSTSGQLGFAELSALCAAINESGAESTIGNHVADLREAAARARAAIERTALYAAA